MKSILQVAQELGIEDDAVKPYGKWKAKIGFEALRASQPIKRRVGSCCFCSTHALGHVAKRASRVLAFNRRLRTGKVDLLHTFPSEFFSKLS
jgi:hypothetical protein